MGLSLVHLLLAANDTVLHFYFGVAEVCVRASALQLTTR